MRFFHAKMLSIFTVPGHLIGTLSGKRWRTWIDVYFQKLFDLHNTHLFLQDLHERKAFIQTVGYFARYSRCFD